MTTTIHPRQLVYVGRANGAFTSVKTIDERTGESADMAESLDGNLDIAKAILCHYLEVDQVSAGLSTSFAMDVVSKFPWNRWRVTRAYISEWLEDRWSHGGDVQVRGDLHG